MAFPAARVFETHVEMTQPIFTWADFICEMEGSQDWINASFCH
jgi:hypothetical protein